MPTKPTSDPTWATDAAANVQEPAGQRTLGYPNGFVPPAGAHNWQFETIGEWLQWLATGGQETDLPDAVAATAAGESFNLDPLGLPYQLDQTSIGSIAFEPSGIAIDAERFFIAYATGPGYIRGYSLDATGDITTGQEEWNGGDTSLGGSENYTKIVSNGTYVAGIFDTEWAIYDATDGTLVYTGDHGAVLYDCCITDEFFFFVGVADGSDIAGGAVALSDGTVTDMASWGVSLDAFGIAAVASDTVIVVAEADGSSNQIGLGEVTSGVSFTFAWQSTVTRTIVSGAQVACNGRFAFVHNGDSGGWLTCFSVANGSEVWEQNYSATLPSLVCDVKDLWLALDDIGILYALDPSTGGIVREFTYPGAVNTTLRPPIATNSNQLIRGIMDTGTLATIVTYTSGLRTRRWTREAIAPHFNQATPEVL
jgi:hypothetical protein